MSMVQLLNSKNKISNIFLDLRVRGSIEESSVGRSVIASGPCASKIFSSNLSRSRSAQSLKLLGDQSSQDDKLTILAQLFWLAVSLLESDFEHEFLLALRLLSRVLHRLPLDRPDCRDKVSPNQANVYIQLEKLCTLDYPAVN